MSVWKPSFYKDFRCLAGDCRHSCCRGWEIDVDAATAELYQQIPGPVGEDLREALLRDEDGWHFRLTREKRCPFLRPDGLCRLIRELGEDSLCDICALHPRFFEELGEDELWGLGLSCEAVCALLLDSAAPLQFISSEGESLAFPALLARLGIDAAETPLYFTPDPSEARYAEILRRLSETEPIDEAWTEELRALRACLADLAENAAETAPVRDRGRYDRIWQYLLFRQLERVEQVGFPALAAYAQLGAEFVFSQDALLGADPEHLRRWSEQIEYSTGNVDLLLSES